MSGAELLPILALVNAVVGNALSAFAVFRKKHFDLEHTKSTEEIWEAASNNLEDGLEQLREYRKIIDPSDLGPLYFVWKKYDLRVQMGLALERQTTSKKASPRSFVQGIKERKLARKAAISEYMNCKLWREEVRVTSNRARNEVTILRTLEGAMMIPPPSSQEPSFGLHTFESLFYTPHEVRS